MNKPAAMPAVKILHLVYGARTTLKSLSLHIKLGHKPGKTCPNHWSVYDEDFVVIDVHVVHSVSLDFCSCEWATSHYKQLLCSRWFPATVQEPRTAAMFAVMEYFHILSFKSKIMAYKFFHMLAQRTDNTGLTPICVSYCHDYACL